MYKFLNLLTILFLFQACSAQKNNYRTGDLEFRDISADSIKNTKPTKSYSLFRGSSKTFSMEQTLQNPKGVRELFLNRDSLVMILEEIVKFKKLGKLYLNEN